MRWSLVSVLALSAWAGDWSRFRGPNGSGVAPDTGLPVAMSLTENLVWRTELPPGYSSPVLTGDRLFVTSRDKDTLYTIALDRKTGRVVWRRESAQGQPLKKGFPWALSAPTPVTDGVNVYVAFDEAGLISYGADGQERWRLKLAPFNTPYGFASSPVLAGNKLLFAVDQDTDSYLLAVDKDSGKQLWKAPRPAHTHSFPSPIVYQPPKGPAQVIVSGSFQVTAYSLETGEKVWWLQGLAWQAKSLPVIGRVSNEDVLFVHSWMAGLAELGIRQKFGPFAEILKDSDKDGDGKLSREETPDAELRKYWFLFDLDKDNYITSYDWDLHISRSRAQNGLWAVRLGGKGDISKTHVLWRYEKSLPNIPSPLLYRDVLYLLKEGGILTALSPATGQVLKQERAGGTLGEIYASPVAADGKLFVLNKEGKLVVIRAGADWDVLKVNELDEETWSTPAIADGRIYVRTMKAVYCFGQAP